MTTIFDATPNPQSPILGEFHDSWDLALKLDEAKKIFQTFTSKTAGWEHEIAKAKTQIESGASKRFDGVLDPQAIKNVVSKETGELRSASASATTDERSALMEKMRKLHEKTQRYVRTQIPSAAALLNRIELGSAKRSEYTAQLATADRRAIEAIGNLAIGEANLQLGACAVARLSAMPEADRPWADPEDYAKALAGPQLAMARKQASDIERYWEGLRMAETAFVIGSTTASEDITFGLADRIANPTDS